MIEELCEIFRKNFPTIVRSDEIVRDILAHEGNHVIAERDEKGKLIGASVINKNTVFMLCVNEEQRRQGIGSRLLRQSEAYIAEAGFDKVVVGVGFDYLMPGVPKLGDNEAFFLGRGYFNSCGDAEVFDMAMELSDCALEYNVGDVINGVTYRFAAEEDVDRVLACMQDAEPGFVEFYRNPKMYDKNDDTELVLIAEKDGAVCGALMIELEGEAPETGSIGCVATVNAYRHQGIGTNMAKVGTKYNKDRGMKYGYLSYTHTGLEKMYGQSGYKITTRYMMAVKDL